MIEHPLSKEEKQTLLKVARESIGSIVARHKLLKLNIEDYSETLQQVGASFVTLTKYGDLRGCIGTLEPYQALVQDVCEHAAAAAVEDYRFAPVSPDELDDLTIEVSRLTIPKPLTYGTPSEIPLLLRPGIDGVVLRDGIRKATFLPQVWKKIPEPEKFLNHLCWKMGLPGDYWQKKRLDVLIYQVEEFSEKDFS